MKKTNPMKSFLLPLLCLFACSSFCLSQETYEYTIKGQLPNSDHDGNKAYLCLEKLRIMTATTTQQENKIDSTQILDGRFTFKGSSTKKGELLLVQIPNSELSCWVTAEPGAIEIVFKKEGPLMHYYVTGTPINDRTTQEFLIPTYNFSAKFDSIQKETATKGEKPSPDAVRALSKEMTEKVLEFIKAHARYPIGEQLFIMLAPVLTEEYLNEILPQVSEEAKSLAEKNRAQVKEQLTALPDSVKVGQKMVDFERKTLTGETLKLSDLVPTKKLILIDFWASWCAPCMREMPELINLYKACKDKGLEIIGISLDAEENSWKKAVETNGMSWLQIIDLEEKGKKLSSIYGIATIPHTLLIDSQGTILARGLRGKELEAEVKKHIDNH